MSNPNSIGHLQHLLGDEISSLPETEQAALAEVWNMVGDAAPVSPEVRQMARSRVAARTRESASTATAPNPLMRLVPGWLLRPMAIAASVALLAAVGWLNRPVDSLYRAPLGATATAFQLPDGSSVQMSPGSEISLGEHFGVSDRAVSLRGEVFFDVRPGETPFVIDTENAVVEVLGTAFNVRSWPEDGENDTRVFVTRGEVRVESPASGMDVRVMPGEATRVQEGTPELPSPADEQRVLAWRNGGIAFSDETVAAVLEEVARRFDVRISAPQSASSQRISFFKHIVEDVDETLADVTDAAGLRYRRTANGFQVFAP